jgi:hypothetical protein
MNAEEVQVWSSQEVEMPGSFGHLRPWLHKQMTPTRDRANFTTH